MSSRACRSGAAPRAEGAPSGDALVVAGTPPDPSGADRSLVAFEVDRAVGHEQILAALNAAGLAAGSVVSATGRWPRAGRHHRPSNRQ